MSAFNAVAMVGRMDADRKAFRTVGTGIIIDPRGLVATAGHVLKAFQQTFTPFEYSEASSLFAGDDFTGAEAHEHLLVAPYPPEPDAQGYVDMRAYPSLSTLGFGTHDIGIIELGGKGGGRPLPSLTLRLIPPTAGQVVSVKGMITQPTLTPDSTTFPKLFEDRTQIAAVEKDFFFVERAVPKGVSGGPILDDETGHVLGLVMETWSRDLAKRTLGIDSPLTKVVSAKVIAAAAAAQYLRAKQRVARGGISYILDTAV